MNRVDISSDPPKEIAGVAYWISSVGRRHVAVFYRPTKKGKPPRFCHLGYHEGLADEPIDASRLRVWATPDVPLRRLKQVPAAARRVFRVNKHSQIPYGFASPEAAFDRTGKLAGEARLGLTCATFSLAVFGYAQIQLVQYDQWRPREGDEKWFEEALAHLELKNVPPERIAELREQAKTAMRFRPEDVVAAASLALPPADFESVESIRPRVCEALD